ncbi:DUF2007 domain-containing protein [Gemmata sp. JC717]|uniref:DUF2007 domain-containing protein n=1 Tax=Gemmata algarum TaxID=2975278 RepID=A0ABU5EZT5_9BACT|nr:DUF2007 domain-containing protein [Gemmata algarum]MDY3552976.1 DUF2007 domain-containing protein [Gemmata algarum]MDY3559139.1 DUF2007 domain-containing protein [Gemmata algarum]
MKRDDGNVVRVFAGPLVLVEMYQGQLKGIGIESRVVGTELAAGLGSALSGSTELWVKEEDLERAKELLTQEEQRAAAKE